MTTARTVGVVARSLGRADVVVALAAVALSACGSCGRKSEGEQAPVSSSSPVVVAEELPRCRGEATHLAIAGEDVVVGDAAIGPLGLLVGLLRVDHGKRVASVLRASLDLGSSSIVDIGPPYGDEPPPSPRWKGDVAYVAFQARRPSDAGVRPRELFVHRLEDGALGKLEATVVQQADESTAFDVAWGESGAGLAAWDEDAPPRADAGAPAQTYAPEGRGFVKVQAFGSETRRVASPDASDAESPRLIARPGGGFWLGWLARRAEDDGFADESPGEKRAFRWVEVVALGASGEAAGPVRRVTSERGRAASFELARSGADLVVIVQDEAASTDGAGARVVRHLVGEHVVSTEIVDGGVGATIAELVPSIAAADGGRWLAWGDSSERARVTPLDPALLSAGRSTLEPSFEGARMLAAGPGDTVYGLVGTTPSESTPVRPQLRRFVCAREASAVHRP